MPGELVPVGIKYPVDKTASYFQTDKVFHHGYFPEYVRIAAELGPGARVLEIGVLGGESLKMWQSLFPLGKITGVDNNRDAGFPQGVTKVIAEQDDPELARLGSFDLIVDDASHLGKLSRKTFDILWPQVNPGGFYVLEDWFVGLPGSAVIRNHSFPSMLATAESFLRLLTGESDCESVHYVYGLAIVKKRPCE
jgi:hypothetical protein